MCGIGAMDLRASGLKSLDSGTSFEAHLPEHNHRLHNALQPLPEKQQWETQWTRTHQLASSKQMPLKCIFISCFCFASHFLLEGWKSCVTKYPKQRYKIVRKKGGYVRTEVGGAKKLRWPGSDIDLTLCISEIAFIDTMLLGLYILATQKFGSLQPGQLRST